MLQADSPDTFVLATNYTVTVRDFVRWAFEDAGVKIEFSGSGVNEIGKNVKTGEVLVKINPTYFRPAEVDLLIGNPLKAKKELGWEPKIKARELCKIMVDADLSRVKTNRDNF